MKATYTKLRSGEWGIRVEGNPKIGQTLTVIKKSGESRNETIAKIVWSGGGVSLCAITRADAGTAMRPNRPSKGRWTGCACGSIEDQPRASDCWSCRHDSE
jgi:hypothetical protein